MRLLTAISFTLAALLGACSVKNPNHCANKQGDDTCKLLYGETYVCSQCTSENSGCVIGPVLDICEASDTTDADTTLVPTTAVDPGTTTTTTSTSSSTSTTTTTDPTTGPLETTTGTTDDTTGSTTVDSTDTTDSTTDTTAGPMCGNDEIEGQETCDGADLGGLNCVMQSDKYNGGFLKCTDDCSALDESDCCLGPGEDCLVNGQDCCPGTTCQLLGPTLLSCKP